jgi:hypothetical protein
MCFRHEARRRAWSAAAAAAAARVVEAAGVSVHVNAAKVSVVAGLVTACVGQAGGKPSQIDATATSRSLQLPIFFDSSIGSPCHITVTTILSIDHVILLLP